jgi:hypothetical protein
MPRRAPAPASPYPARATVAAVLVAVCLGPLPAGAAPIRSLAWDFATGPGGWTASNTFLTSPPPQAPRWTWSAAERSWGVDAAPVNSPAYRSGNFLTSPLIDVAPGFPADRFTFSIAHRFTFPADGLVRPGYRLPVVAGQVTYSLDGGPFRPLPTADWTTTGTLPAPLAAVVQAPGWTVPQFVPGTAPVLSLPPLVDGGAAFTGRSAGFTSGWFQASQAFEVEIPVATRSIQFRFTNMNLGQKCGLDAGWDVRLATLDLIFAPEPAGGGLALAGGLLGAAVWIGRRCMRPPRRLARPAGGRVVTSGPRGRA